jgi:septum formation protein
MSLFPLILASASPRRRELLNQAGLRHLVLPSAAHERFGKGGVAFQAQRLALKKAEDVARRLRRRGERKGLVIGADTIVAKAGKLLAKPRDARHATAMLRLLSGSAHEVVTGLALVPVDRRLKPWTGTEKAKVFFRKLGADEIEAYVHSGDPLDKAGGYGIQSGAASFVRRIEGDYFNVVGLPLARLVEALRKIGYAC